MTDNRRPADRTPSTTPQKPLAAQRRGQTRKHAAAEVRRLIPGQQAGSKAVVETCKKNTEWTLYILRCSDGSLYTGITTDVQRRLDEHNGLAPGAAGRRGAAYTRQRRPVTLIYREPHADRSSASRREWAIKRLSRKSKLKLVSSPDTGTTAHGSSATEDT